MLLFWVVSISDTDISRSRWCYCPGPSIRR
jgi:hypothetical protein